MQAGIHQANKEKEWHMIVCTVFNTNRLYHRNPDVHKTVSTRYAHAQLLLFARMRGPLVIRITPYTTCSNSTVSRCKCPGSIRTFIRP